MLGTGEALKKLESRSAFVQPVTTGGVPANVGCRIAFEVRLGNWLESARSAAAAPSEKNESPVIRALVGPMTPFTCRNCESWLLMSSGLSTTRDTLTWGIGMSCPSQFVGVKWP